MKLCCQVDAKHKRLRNCHLQASTEEDEKVAVNAESEAEPAKPKVKIHLSLNPCSLQLSLQCRNGHFKSLIQMFSQSLAVNGASSLFPLWAAKLSHSSNCMACVGNVVRPGCGRETRRHGLFIRESSWFYMSTAF